jgi:hypothetical protein
MIAFLQVKAIEQKLSKQWKARLDQQESEWQQRMTKVQKDAEVKVAEHKAQSHEELNKKDTELCNWIAKCHEVGRLLIVKFFLFPGK